MKDVTISKLQFSLLIIGSITVTGHLIITALVFERSGKDSWLSLFVSSLIAFIIVLLISLMAERFPKQPFTQLIHSSFLTPLGKIITLLYFCYFMLISIVTLKLLMDFMTTAFMTRTPQIAILIPFLFLCGFVQYSGLEGFARVNEFLLPFLILGGVTASMLSMPSKDYYNLLPVLENGFDPVFLGALPLIGLFCELIVIAFIYNKVKFGSKVRKINIILVLIIVLMFLGPLTGPIATFGPQVLKDISYPTFTQIAYIKLDLIENLQPIAIFLWVFGSFGKVCLFYFASIKSLQAFLGTDKYKSLIVPIGIALGVLSLWLFPTLITLKKFVSTIYIYIGLLLGLVIPGVILIVKRKK